MNKTVIIILSVALLLSLAGVGFLVFQNIDKTKTITQLSGELKNTKNSLAQTETKLTQTENKLTQTEIDLSKAQNDLSEKNKQIDSIKSDNKNLLSDKVNLTNKLSKAMCGKTIDADSIKSVTTNAGLIDSITKVVETHYNFSSIDTFFKVAWNNNKTAIFDIMNKDRTTVKVVVSWDFAKSQINGIYDINSACFYYIP